MPSMSGMAMAIIISSLSSCLTQHLYKESNKLTHFQPIIGMFGLLGNVLTFSVLSSKEMNNSFNKLIQALAVFDSIFIIFVSFEYTFVRGNYNSTSKQ